MEIYAVPIRHPISRAAYEKLLQLPGKAKREKIERYRRWKDAHFSLVADLLVRLKIKERTHLENHRILFATNEYGKPVLASEADARAAKIHFNVSHSGEWIACAISDTPVGIDIERMDPSIDLSIARKFFSHPEYGHIERCGTRHEKVSLFYDYWTLKESFVKAVGKGLSIPFDSFAIRMDGGHIRVQTAEPGVFRFKTYDFRDGYKLAVCAAGDRVDFPSRIIELEMEDVVRKALEELA